ncbi:hypothetical protein TSAR_011395 [Trichomalopsis sarcophagae]|uniref:DDE Tnp4 domain-containing protein n=1 Tax=Trichomalopsis sarcophagae TaxID=543379 RepID=A0A232ETV6_9HYME|nr:hypothetical protein TSAR_011395 [Trichomalopsis sarcophagae]
MPLFLSFPSRQQFQVIAHEFMEDLHFPNCIGALDGKHCKIRKPRGSGSLFYNFKNFHSIVLMACCDSKKSFIWANIGDYGSCNDASVFAESDFGHALLNNQIQLPPSQPLPNTQIQSPYVLIGDGGFPLKDYLMKPFLRNDNITMPHRVFNYRLSHARRIVESAFGEVTERWILTEIPLEHTEYVNSYVTILFLLLGLFHGSGQESKKEPQKKSKVDTIFCVAEEYKRVNFEKGQLLAVFHESFLTS